MKILILKTDFFRKKNMRTIFVGSSYDIYVLEGFCDQIPLMWKINKHLKIIVKYQKSTQYFEFFFFFNNFYSVLGCLKMATIAGKK